MSTSKWVEISCTADAEAAETLSELFSRFAPNRVAVQREPTASGDDTPLELNPEATVTAYLPAGKRTDRAVAYLERCLWLLGTLRPVGELRVRAIDESDWAEAWKEFFPVHRVGERVVIRPSWREYVPEPDDIVVDLDPGLAFGTGLHPTTQMVLVALQRRLRQGDRVLDVGCGSGILAIAAAKLGAASVLALDVDPQAVRVARANVKANGLSRRTKGSRDVSSMGQVTVARGSLPRAEQFDLVLINIFARVLIELAPHLAAALRPGGVAVASGLIEERATDVGSAFAEVGLREIERQQSGDWMALTVERSGG